MRIQVICAMPTHNLVPVGLLSFSHLAMGVSLVVRVRVAPPSFPHSQPAVRCMSHHLLYRHKIYTYETISLSITTVGATTGVPETAADFSSGGFSNYFGTPSYQTSAHATYLNAIGSTNSGKFNASGRGFPDVSAMGENVEIVWDAETGTVAGTSCSSPIFASVVALLNDELIAAGKSPLGFLNPFLYSTGASALNDITTGALIWLGCLVFMNTDHTITRKQPRL